MEVGKLATSEILMVYIFKYIAKRDNERLKYGLESCASWSITSRSWFAIQVTNNSIFNPAQVVKQDMKFHNDSN